MLTYEQALEKLLAAAQPVEEVRRVPLLAVSYRGRRGPRRGRATGLRLSVICLAGRIRAAA